MSNKQAIAGVYSLLDYAPTIDQGGRVIDAQRTFAERWGKKNKLPLNRELTARPNRGAFESFYADINGGRVRPGSVLIVDGLDLDAINAPAIAQSYLGQIVGAGITVVMAADGRTYSPESVRANPLNIVHSMMYMMRAHEEANPATVTAEPLDGCEVIPLRKKTMTGKVYSYIRFSAMEQRHGNSVERQSSYAAKWAAEHGMTLDDTLTMRDEGLSAYHQRHITNGEFGVFLKSIETGRVAPGSVLIVEGFDRISRADALTAQGQLAMIINAGVTVVTAADGKTYSQETLRRNPMDLVYSLIVMIRAHEESETKSDRVSKGIIKKCENWVNGISFARNTNGRDPVWLTWNKEKKNYDINEEKAEFVRHVINLHLAGYGWHRIARMVEEQNNLPYCPNRKRQLAKLLETPASLIGIRTVHCSNGQEYVLKGYYPAIIDQDTYNSIVSVTRTRYTRRAGRPPTVPGILANGVCRCGYCGTAMFSTSDGCKTKPDENGIEKPYMPRRYRCGNAQCQTRSLLIAPIEHAIMDFCSSQMNLNSLVGRDRSGEIRVRIAANRAALVESERQLKRIVDALLGTDAPPAAFAARAREIESEIASLNHAIKVDESALLHEANAPTKQAAEKWAQLRADVKADDYDARITVRTMVGETFDKVVIYRHGLNGEQPPKHYRDKEWTVLLVSRSGVTRQIIVSRTGELIGLADETREDAAA